MINKISSLGSFNAVSRPMFKANESEKQVITEPKYETKVPEAIANYGIAAIKMAKRFDIKPLEPIIVDPNITEAIEGERIYTSTGELHSITNESDKTKTIYLPNKENNKILDTIEIVDKETGKVIYKQINFV